jgi:hypothetical protein
MGNSSPTALMFGGMVVASMSFRLKENYAYLSYAAVIIGFVMFVMGIIKFVQQRNKY